MGQAEAVAHDSFSTRSTAEITDVCSKKPYPLRSYVILRIAVVS